MGISNESKTTWFESKSQVIIWLIILFPIGLIGLWKSSKFSRNVKIAVTAIISALLISFVISNNIEEAEKVKLAKQQEQIAEEQKQQQINALRQEFITNKATILKQIQSFASSKNYEEAVKLASKYLFVNDTELNNIHKTANDKFQAIEAKRIKAELEIQKAAELAANRKKLIEEQFSAWDGSHITLSRFIKENMNDPKSYKHVKTTYWEFDNHLIVQTSFRGTNAFGAVILNTIKAKVGLDGTIIQIISQN